MIIWKKALLITMLQFALSVILIIVAAAIWYIYLGTTQLLFWTSAFFVGVCLESVFSFLFKGITESRIAKAVEENLGLDYEQAALLVSKFNYFTSVDKVENVDRVTFQRDLAEYQRRGLI